MKKTSKYAKGQYGASGSSSSSSSSSIIKDEDSTIDTFESNSQINSKADLSSSSSPVPGGGGAKFKSSWSNGQNRPKMLRKRNKYGGGNTNPTRGGRKQKANTGGYGYGIDRYGTNYRTTDRSSNNKYQSDVGNTRKQKAYKNRQTARSSAEQRGRQQQQANKRNGRGGRGRTIATGERRFQTSDGPTAQITFYFSDSANDDDDDEEDDDEPGADRVFFSGFSNSSSSLIDVDEDDDNDDTSSDNQRSSRGSSRTATSRGPGFQSNSDEQPDEIDFLQRLMETITDELFESTRKQSMSKYNRGGRGQPSFAGKANRMAKNRKLDNRSTSSQNIADSKQCNLLMQIIQNNEDKLLAEVERQLKSEVTQEELFANELIQSIDDTYTSVIDAMKDLRRELAKPKPNPTPSNPTTTTTPPEIKPIEPKANSSKPEESPAASTAVAPENARHCS